MLTIVATPIGNLGDITLRSLEALKNCDAIICEDTRRTAILLNHFEIKKPLIILNDFNESRNVSAIMDRLNLGQNLCLVSDAGTPLVSDPGFKLVRECLNSEIEVDSLPGPSSIITALTLSTLPPDKFTFLGYPPDKSGHRQTFFQSILESSKSIKATYIIFVAPFKLQKTFEEMQNNFGDIEVVVAKELTKIHQNVKTQTISDWLKNFKTQPPRGEYIVLFRVE